MIIPESIISKNGVVNWVIVLHYVLVSYLILLPISFLFLTKYAFISTFSLPILPILVISFINKIQQVILIFISLLPIIQHNSYRGVAIGDFFINVHMVFLLVIILLVLNNYLYTYSYKDKDSPTLIDKLILLLAIVSILSLIFANSLDVNHTKRWLLFYTGIFETVSFFYVILFYLKKDKNYSEKVIMAILLSTFSSLIIAIIEFREVGFSLVNIFLARMHIGFGYHNMNLYGINSAILIPISFYALLSPRFKRFKKLTTIILIINIVLAVLTLNRGTFLILGVQLFLLSFIKETRKIVFGIIVVGIAGALQFSNLLLLYLQRFIGDSGGSQLMDMVDKSAQYRIDAWNTALKLLWIYPFGLGAGGFQYGWEKYGTDPTFYLGTPHQLFLSIGVDYGVLAMIVFIIFIITSILYSNKLSKFGNTDSSYQQKFITISLISYVAYGMITVGELSHLSGFKYPNNGYTLVLLSLIAITSYNYSKMKSFSTK
ncbi:MAG: O-antigen ligase family protein [Ignavibacteriaceae bacterium]|jgi:hypothetical protein